MIAVFGNQVGWYREELAPRPYGQGAFIYNMEETQKQVKEDNLIFDYRGFNKKYTSYLI